MNSPKWRNTEKTEVNAALMLISSISIASGARICSSIGLVIGGHGFSRGEEYSGVRPLVLGGQICFQKLL